MTIANWLAWLRSFLVRIASLFTTKLRLTPYGVSYASGRRRALLIGVNHAWPTWFAAGTRGEDRQDRAPSAPYTYQHSDVIQWHDFITMHYAYRPKEVVVMMDHPGFPLEMQPTRENVLREIQELVRGSRRGDHFFFFYAGHGNEPDTEIESHRHPEILCADGAIQDVELRQIMVDSLARGSRLTALLDSCYSATVLDLAHYECNSPSYVVSERSLFTLMRAIAKFKIMARRATHNSRGYYGNTMKMTRTTTRLRYSECTGSCKPEKPSDKRAEVVSLAPCSNFETTWGTFRGGTFTQALLDLLSKDTHPRLRDLTMRLTDGLKRLNDEMKNYIRNNPRDLTEEEREAMLTHEQVPQFGSQRTLDLDSEKFDP